MRSLLRTQGMAQWVPCGRGRVALLFFVPSSGSRRKPSFYEGGHCPYFVHLFTESASSHLIFTWSRVSFHTSFVPHQYWHCSCLPPSAKILFCQMWKDPRRGISTLPSSTALLLRIALRSHNANAFAHCCLFPSHTSCAKHLLPSLFYTFKAPSLSSKLLDS